MSNRNHTFAYIDKSVERAALDSIMMGRDRGGNAWTNTSAAPSAPGANSSAAPSAPGANSSAPAAF